MEIRETAIAVGLVIIWIVVVLQYAQFFRQSEIHARRANRLNIRTYTLWLAIGVSLAFWGRWWSHHVEAVGNAIVVISTIWLLFHYLRVTARK